MPRQLDITEYLISQEILIIVSESNIKTRYRSYVAVHFIRVAIIMRTTLRSIGRKETVHDEMNNDQRLCSRDRSRLHGGLLYCNNRVNISRR